MAILIIGDCHATPQEIPDCEALWGMVKETVEKYDCSHVILLGDQYNTHDILNTRVIDFWSKAFRTLSSEVEIIAIVGNHDQCTPTIRHPHSMISHSADCDIIDKPCCVNNFCMMPYYANPEEFVKEAVALKKTSPQIDTLFCHQTFVGAEQGLGFYIKDSVDPVAIPFKLIISGHIHRPMNFGKVWYPGCPRWRTLTDADVNKRAIWVWDTGKPPIPVYTNKVCTRIYRFDDSQDAQIDKELDAIDLKLADIRVSVSGTFEYITKRITELKTKYNAKCRGIPTKSRLVRTSESEGVEKAFFRFSSSFTPPFGTDKELLLREAAARLQLQI